MLPVFQVKEVSLNDILGDIIPGVEEANAGIGIPREVLGSLDNEDRIRMASLLFRNMSGLLPERLEGNNNHRFVYDMKFE